MKFGKHTDEALKIKQLEDKIKRKDREIKDIKIECAEQFGKIKNLCYCNTYNEKLDKLRTIYEIAYDNFSILVKDLLINESEETKIIELSNTRKVNK